MRRWRDDRGATPIEMIAVVPIAILIGLAVWQLLLVGYTATVAQEAARTGARAAAAAADGGAAARAALPDGMDATVSAGCGGGTVPQCSSQVSARVPRVLPVMPVMPAVTRNATMPGEAD